MKTTILTRSRIRARRLGRVLLGLVVLGFITVEITASQAEPRIFVADRSLKVAISGPSEGIVDRPVEFRVEVQNAASAPSAEMDLIVFAGRADFSIRLSEKEDDRLPGKLIDAASKATRLSLPVLVAKETRTFTVALTPRRIGTFRASVALDRKGQSSPVIAAVVAGAEVPIKFDSQAGVADFLPTAPKSQPRQGLLPLELSQVPEIALCDPLPPSLTVAESRDRIAHDIDKIKHVNKRERDAYIAALLEKRTDLAGLPFITGDDCQMPEERGWQFATALSSLRTVQAGLSVFGTNANRTFTNVSSTMANVGGGSIETVARAQAPFPRAVVLNESPVAKTRSTGITETPDPVKMMEEFRRTYALLAHAELASETKRPDLALREGGIPGRVGVVMQVLTAESIPVRLAMVEHLAGTSHIEATRALAKLAIFSDENEVRQKAIEALKIRREKDYSDILVEGLQYPWPAVARRACEAIVKLQRSDLIPQLLDVLDRPDPRAPRDSAADGKKGTFVRELVRINHLRNCLLCHAPAESSESLMRMLTAPVPNPKQALAAPDATLSSYGSRSQQDLLVRVDVTYLRQDFSAKLPVAGADPWPSMQRFDFVVRTRDVTEEEAKELQRLLHHKAGAVSPYHRAALFALRELTGLDAEPSGPAWRKLLAR